MSSASQGLRELVEGMIDLDEALDEETGLLILAALDGEAAFAAELGDSAGGPPTPPVMHETPSTSGSYLASITVEGFRGIGTSTTLELEPGPGLTLVVGRNGSGKSSFAEAAELAITGANRRWDGQRSAVWREGWRNLHHPDPARIVVETVGDGAPATVSRSWGPGDRLDGGSWTRQVRGGRVESIGKPDDVVAIYRPFLSYNELGSVIDGRPSDLHDALYRLLGLETLADAHRRITASRKEIDARVKAGAEARQRLLDQVDGLDDDRAALATSILRARKVDLRALGDLALGSDEDDRDIALLRTLSATTLPPADVVADAALELEEARESLAATSSEQAQASADLARLLRLALDHHRSHGDTACPICGRGAMDAPWRDDADRRATEAEEGARALDEARRRVDRAHSELARLLVGPPTVLAARLPVPTDALLEAWTRWHEAIHAPDVTAAIETADSALRTALAATLAAAESELDRRDESWRPVATALVALHEQLARIEKESVRLADLKKAERWVKDTTSTIRDERMAPFADRSQQVWNELRQQSNIDLGPIRLEGSSTQRRATFDVAVDGVEGAALGVMSQGELHSLALSLFLPRATVEESPFRFVLIDDPVQAMDPAKVDGLAHVLATVAHERQVVVFSHDDRLAESVRRAQQPARIVEVVRQDHSRVDLRVCDDPVTRHLDDGRALVRSDHVPEDLRRELVASFCRSALEAAAQAAFRRARLSKGDHRADVETRLEKAHKLHQVLTLAVFHDESRDADLYRRLRSAGPRAVDVVTACKQGAHRGHSGDLNGLVADTKSLCLWIDRQ